jgi:hypothetical protein
MAVYAFSTTSNPAHFVEIEDPSNPGQAIRPPTGSTLLVRNSADHTALPSQVTLNLGYVNFTVNDVPVVDVSADSGATWFTFYSAEAQYASFSAGQTANTALATANSALSQLGVLVSSQPIFKRLNTTTGAFEVFFPIVYLSSSSNDPGSFGEVLGINSIWWEEP